MLFNPPLFGPNSASMHTYEELAGFGVIFKIQVRQVVSASKFCRAKLSTLPWLGLLMTATTVDTKQGNSPLMLGGLVTCQYRILYFPRQEKR